MSATRLLVLGAVRIMQPVHGYDVRRELVSWHLEESAHIKPGSIYSALKTLTKDGLVEAAAGDADKPDRTSYLLTGEGEKEFQALLRAAWWRVVQPTEPLVPGLCLLPFLPREELVAALQSRIAQLTASLDEARFIRAGIQDGATGQEGGVPEHVREIVDFVTARAKGELTWTKELLKRVRAGAYTFSGEAEWLDLGPGKGARR
ncbi:MAG: PadR family transcriptional regulator [Actinomycetota bacterium]|nr:PadR family transcriptional regulator [Actinomycetota bacterium]